MSHQAFPTETDVVNRLTGADIDPEIIALLQEAGTIGDAARAAVKDWEDATDWHPYLAGTEETRYFDPPVRYSGGAALPGSRLGLTVPVASLTAIRVGGQLLQNDTGFTLGPSNSGVAEKPWLWVLFRSPQGTTPASIAITGRFGAVTAIPENIWEAILQQALTILAPDLALAISEGTTEKKTGDVTKRFVAAGGNGQVDLQAKLREARWNRLVQNNRRQGY